MPDQFPGQLIGSGEAAGSATAAAFTSRAAKWVRFIAANDNAGSVYIGGSTVTKKAGTTTSTAGWALEPGKESPLIRIPLDDFARLYRICDNAGDDVMYLLFD